MSVVSLDGEDVDARCSRAGISTLIPIIARSVSLMVVRKVVNVLATVATVAACSGVGGEVGAGAVMNARRLGKKRGVRVDLGARMSERMQFDVTAPVWMYAAALVCLFVG